MSVYLKPGDPYTSRFSSGVANTGLVGTVRFRLLDADPAVDDPVVAPTTADITEDPTGSGDYLYQGAAIPTTLGKYFPAWDLGSGQLYYDEDIIVSFSAPGALPSGDSYATVDELFRILKIRTPSSDQTTAGERVLVSAAGEINSEIDLEEGNELAGWQLSLAAEVNLERAVELWRLEETSFGIVGLGSEFGASHIARNTWDKYAYTLAPLKEQWGLA